MATATLTSQLANTLLDPGSPTSIGTGNAQQSETVIQKQGANCSAMGHSGSVGPASPSAINEFRGMYATITSLSRTGNHIHLWMRDLYPVRNKSVGGVSAYIFGSSEALYYASGLDDGYGGGWYHYVLNLDPGDRPAADLGTAPSANITRVGYCGNISATKGEDFLQNSYLDAIRAGGDGVGITFIGGVTGDRLTLLDCANADLDSYGLLRNLGGSLKVEGPLTFGTAAGTTWIEDILQTVTFTNFTVGDGVTPSVAVDYYHLDFVGNGAGSTHIFKTDVTWKGVSRALPFNFSALLLGAGDEYSSIRSTYIFCSAWAVNQYYVCQGDTFIECGALDPTNTPVHDPKYTNCDSLDLTDALAQVDGGSTQGHNTATGVAFVTTDDPSKVLNHAITAGAAGHFMEATAIGTFGITGITGWGTAGGYAGTPGSNATPASGSLDAGFYNNSGGLITLNLPAGVDIPTVRNGAAATTVINQTSNLTIINVPNGGILSLFDNDDLPADPNDLGTLLQVTNPTTGANVVYGHQKGGDDIQVQYVDSAYVEVNFNFILNSADQTLDLGNFLTLEENL